MEAYACEVTAAIIIVCIMIKNSGELIALAQPLIFIYDLIHLLVKFGGGKYQQYKWLKVA